ELAPLHRTDEEARRSVDPGRCGEHELGAALARVLHVRSEASALDGALDEDAAPHDEAALDPLVRRIEPLELDAELRRGGDADPTPGLVFARAVGAERQAEDAI